jgi:hypothetical protein
MRAFAMRYVATHLHEGPIMQPANKNPGVSVFLCARGLCLDFNSLVFPFCLYVFKPQ